MHPSFPLAVPHASVEDDIHDGYFIPNGTIVIGNTWHAPLMVYILLCILTSRYPTCAGTYFTIPSSTLTPFASTLTGLSRTVKLTRKWSIPTQLPLDMGGGYAPDDT